MSVLKPHYKSGDTPDPSPANMQVRREHAALHCLYILSGLIRNTENAMLNGVLTDMQVDLEEADNDRKKWTLREVNVVNFSNLITEGITTLPEVQAEDLVTLCQHYCVLTHWNAPITEDVLVMINTYASNVKLATVDDVKNVLWRK